ncbi:hypothetical protein ASG72_15255 [Bosea sp. Leaf344]|nr:hypothetical protein ASG72_15255 [Bosea sp. Leaf344]
MALLGFWVERRIRASWVQSMAEAAAVYLESFLSPHIQDVDLSAPLPPDSAQAIGDLLAHRNLSRRVAAIRIWNLEGKLLYSTPGTALHGTLKQDYLNRVRNRETLIEMDDDGHDGHVDHAAAHPDDSRLIEIYAPIFEKNTRNVIAVGEFYEFSSFLHAEVDRAKYSTWLIVAIVASLLMVMIYFTMRRASRVVTEQRSLLERNIERASSMARRDNTRRRAVERARLDASLLNETYLASVGADLHDGPIQLLSLLMLKMPQRDEPVWRSPGAAADPSFRDELEKLIQLALADLRNLSAGLVLPETQHLSLTETLDLAIRRHEENTGTRVRRSIGPMPSEASDAVRICLYRVVQEALTNAYKHAGGVGQTVTARHENGSIDLAISNAAGRQISRPQAPAHQQKLGLKALESRVGALGGTVSIRTLEDGGTRVEVTIPLAE